MSARTWGFKSPLAHRSSSSRAPVVTTGALRVPPSGVPSRVVSVRRQAPSVEPHDGMEDPMALEARALLRRLARAHGVQTDYVGQDGSAQTVPDEALVKVLAALGVSVRPDGVAALAEALEEAALAELRARRPDRVLETNVEFWAAIVLDFAEVDRKSVV